MSAARSSALPRRRLRWRASVRIVPADLPPLPLARLDDDPRFLDAAALLLGAADAAAPDQASVSSSGRASAEVSALLAPLRFPGASRFSDGRFGLYYAARELDTAISETVHHDVRRLRDMDESVALDKQVFIASIEGSLRSLVGREAEFPGVDAPEDYTASRALGRQLFEQRVPGLVYASVRRPAGRCVAVFDPGIIGPVARGVRLRYHYDAGQGKVVEIEEIRRIDLPNEPTA